MFSAPHLSPVLKNTGKSSVVRRKQIRRGPVSSELRTSFEHKVCFKCPKPEDDLRCENSYDQSAGHSSSVCLLHLDCSSISELAFQVVVNGLYKSSLRTNYIGTDPEDNDSEVEGNLLERTGTGLLRLPGPLNHQTTFLGSRSVLCAALYLRQRRD